MIKHKLRVVFMGTPEFAVASLKAIVEANYEVVGVITAPDKPAGRNLKLTPSEVKVYAESVGLRILQPEKLKNEEFLSELRALKADIQVVVAFRMLPEVVWNMPPLGTFNIHASLLPQYRGAAPIHWAVINGEKETGVSSFFLQHEIDTGDIIAQKRLTIGEEETTGELYSRLMNLGAELAVETLDAIEEGRVNPTPQTFEGALKMAPKIFKEDAELNFHQSAEEVRNFIRGMNPFPGAWMLGNGKKLKIAKAQLLDASLVKDIPTGIGELYTDNKSFAYVLCKEGAIALLELQAEGKRMMPIEEFLRGNKF